MTNYDQRGNIQTLNWPFIWRKRRISIFLLWLRWEFREFGLSKNTFNIDPQTPVGVSSNIWCGIPQGVRNS